MDDKENNLPGEIPAEAPKKRGRKPKAQKTDENPEPVKKRRGRPRKNPEIPPQTNVSSESAKAENGPAGTLADGDTPPSPLDETLDSAVKQRKSRRIRGPKIPREDGPQWRDAPVSDPEPERHEESPEIPETEIFVHRDSSDDFAYGSPVETDVEKDERNDDGENVPTSFSTTDDDLDPEGYRAQAETTEDDDERRIAEAREYENAVDDAVLSSHRQGDGRNKWQKRDRDNRYNGNGRAAQQNRQGGGNGQQNRQNQPNGRFDRNAKNGRLNQQNRQGGGNGQQNRQNQQNLRQQQNAQKQKKPRWMQNQNSEDDTINPADLPEWFALKSQKSLDEYLAQTFFDKKPEQNPEPFLSESFETATPIELDDLEKMRAERQEDAATAPLMNEIAEPPATQQGEDPDAETTPGSAPEQSGKNISDMGYWELMANANDSAAKKYGLAKKADTSDSDDKTEPEAEALQSDAQSDAKPFEEPSSVNVPACGQIDSIGGLDEIRRLGIRDIRDKYDETGIPYRAGAGKSELISDYFKFAKNNKKLVKAKGTLDVFEDGFGGAIAFADDNYRLKRNSIYVPQMFIDKYGLKRGHTVGVLAMPPRDFGRETCPIAVSVTSVMDADPETAKNITPFTDLIPYYPTRRIIMEADASSGWDNLSMRAVDLLTPIGFGQRALIVAPPRTGKTVLMQGMAKSIRRNAPHAHLMILLVDERPEEVTDFKRNVDAEVIASTFDEEASNHVHAAEMIISRARRLVEEGRDVVILLDSITRLARAYNALMPNGGRTMSGGVEANALQKPKKFFGSARNIEGGGSLTIIGTALIETGSKMDEVIFEEFKGTGNLELHLDRGLSDKRIFPAINIEKSGTRKEELLYHPDEMSKIYALRRAMKGVPATDAMEMLVQRLKKVPTNIEFLLGINR